MERAHNFPSDAFVTNIPMEFFFLLLYLCLKKNICKIIYMFLICFLIRYSLCSNVNLIQKQATIFLSIQIFFIPLVNSTEMEWFNLKYCLYKNNPLHYFYQWKSLSRKKKKKRLWYNRVFVRQLSQS